MFDIEPLGELVKLTVVHDGFERGSLVAKLVTQGWPAVLAGLRRCSRLERPSRKARSPYLPSASV
jgi:hypothetical protein